MIKEISQDIIDNEFDCIIDSIVEYFGEEYSKEIKDRADKVKVMLIREKGIFKTNEGEIYVGDEPVCIKEEDGANVIIPLSLMGDPRGNVAFIHVLLHALGEECFIKEGKDAFNEVVVDYMANDICKMLEEEKLNITMSNKPIYESNSFYSNMFEEIDDFYNENVDKIIAARMGRKVEFDDVEEIAEYIDSAQQVVDKAFFEEVGKEDFKIKKR